MSLTSRSDTGEARMRKTSCRLTNNQYLQSMDHRLFMTGEKSQLLISPSPDFVERPFFDFQAAFTIIVVHIWLPRTGQTGNVRMLGHPNDRNSQFLAKVQNVAKANSQPMDKNVVVVVHRIATTTTATLTSSRTTSFEPPSAAMHQRRKCLHRRN